jgi:hypothetical protein
MKSSKTHRVYLLLALLVTTNFLKLSSAFAGYLTINGTSTITATVEGDKIKFSGVYSIDNTGDETAKNVFPALSLGSWKWAGEPRELLANVKESWPIEGTLTQEMLLGEAKPGENRLPSKGQFPLLVHRHYEDMNGVHFSAPDVSVITLGELTQDDLSSIRIPQINSVYTCLGDGKEFACLLDLRNLSDSEKKVSVSYHTSQELQVETAASINLIKPRAQFLVESQIKNFAGLTGSGYAVFAVLEWEDRGVRKSAAVSRVVNIKEPEKKGWFLWGASLSLIFLGLLLYLLVFKKSSSGRPRK